MRRVVGVATVLFWASAALMTVLVVLFWVTPGLREERSLNLLGGIFVGLALVSSGFLFWQERRAIRQESRTVRRESREISVEEDEEWTPRAWLYATAFGLSFFLSWYLCCQPCSSPPEQATSLRGGMPSGTGVPAPEAYSPECLEGEFCELRTETV
jgi:hypothetical protein